MRIFKYKLIDYIKQNTYKPFISFEILMYPVYKYLTVQAQDGHLTLWALVDDSQKKVTNEFRIYGTGFELRNEGIEKTNYLGTAQAKEPWTDIPLVWHVFEVKK